MHLLDEKENWRTINKPTGSTVFRNRKQPDRRCLFDWYRDLYPDCMHHSWPTGFDGGIAHRLDTPTTGLLIAAKTPMALESIRSDFQQKSLRKIYFFISTKNVEWKRHHMTAEIGHDKRRKSRMIVKRGANTPIRGRWLKAETAFEHIGNALNCNLWKAEMHSGVMHQIRIHAAFAGIALAGDKLYGGGAPLSWTKGDAFALHHYGIPQYGWADFPTWWPKALISMAVRWIETHLRSNG